MRITVNELMREDGTSPFEAWFNKLNAAAASKVTTALYRLEHGNFSNVKSVRGGVFECRINFALGAGFILDKMVRKLLCFWVGEQRKGNKQIST